MSRARSWVADNRTGQAYPASAACNHRAAHTHQPSPGDSPTNPYSGRGVDKSLPTDFENSRNSVVTVAHTV